MTIWRDWTGTNSVTGKPRPGATLHNLPVGSVVRADGAARARAVLDEHRQRMALRCGP